MKKVLVTGGLGFIGSHLVDSLLKRKYEVTIIDNQASSVVKPEEYSSSCRVVNKSIRDWKPRVHFHEIYHLASPVGPVGVLEFGGKLGYEIVADTQRVVNWAVRMKAKLLFTSTSELYGRSGRFSEDVIKHVSPTVSVRLAYGVGKLLAEIDLLNFANEKKSWVTIVRPFNIAGPRQSSEGGFVLPRFIEQAIVGKPITVYSDGSQLRSLTHVYDVVIAMLKVMGSKKAKGEIFNIGNPQNEMTILNLAKLVKRITGSKSRIELVDPVNLHGKRFAEAFNKIPDMRKMEKLYSWIPSIGIEQVVNDALEFYRNKKKEE